MVFRGGGGEGAVARIFLSTTLNVPWNDAATLATTRFCRRENSRLGYRYTGDPLSCRMSRWKMRLLFGWTHLEEKRNRSPFHDFTILDIEISADKSDKPRLTKFFSTSRFGERSKRYNSENLENLRGIRRIYWLLFINIFFWFRFDKRLNWFIYAAWRFSFETILEIFSQTKFDSPAKRILLQQQTTGNLCSQKCS